MTSLKFIFLPILLPLRPCCPVAPAPLTPHPGYAPRSIFLLWCITKTRLQTVWLQVRDSSLFRWKATRTHSARETRLPNHRSAYGHCSGTALTSASLVA